MVPSSFAEQILRETCNIWWWMNVYVDVFFGIDICCNLRTGYTTPNGALIMDPRLSAKEYIFSYGSQSTCHDDPIRSADACG